VAARATSTYSFYGCTGPGPDSFDAVKTALPAVTGAPVSAAAAFQVTDGSATFVVLTFGDAFKPHGIEVSGVATTACWVDVNGGQTTLLYTGIWVPTP
jgi:hypothetical protein